MFQLLLIIIYLSFISLGLPDALLGAAWPSIHQEFQVPVSYAGVISMIISVGTIISSLQSDRLIRNRKGNRCQRGDDSGGIVWIFHQPFLCGAVSVGDPLWSWSRKCGCLFE